MVNFVSIWDPYYYGCLEVFIDGNGKYISLFGSVWGSVEGK